MEQEEYLNKYESELTQQLLRMLTSMQLLNGQLLESPDINEKWERSAQSYIADAAKEIVKYPLVSLGWAMYFGMGVAHYWDDDWGIYGNIDNLYEYIRDKRGFDFMDEFVREDILMLKDAAFDQTQKVVQSCAQQTLSKIRHEQIEPQSPLAYYVYLRSVNVMYKVGAALQLKSLGYKFEKI